MGSARVLLPLVAFPLLILPLLLAPLPVAAGFTNVSVSLTGPDEGWVTDDLQYDANPVCEVDAETQAKLSSDEAILTTALYWNFWPATLVAGGRASDATTTIRYDNCWAGYYTVTVTYLCSLTYPGGGGDYAYAEDSQQVKIKRVMMYAMTNAYAICTGAKNNPMHQVDIVACVSDGLGGPLGGRTVEFSADHPFAHTGPAINPTSAETDAYGNAWTSLTSGDDVTLGNVQVTCEDTITWVPINFEKSSIYLAVLDPVTGQPLISLVPDGESQARVSLYLGHTGPVPGHDIEWKLRCWSPEKNPWADPPDYEGTGDATHGTLNPTSATTDANGAASTIYTCGTVLGALEFVATDTSVHVRP